MSAAIPFDAADAERLAIYRAAREREDGAMLRVQREKIATALTIADTRRRDRELTKIASSLHGYVWCRELADAARSVARLVDDYVRYHDRDDKDALIRSTRTTAVAGPTLRAWAGMETP